MRDVVTAILGGGRGARLWPLTRDRAKPAVPVAGKYRLIDIPISNSIDAGHRPHLRADPVQQRQPAPPHRPHLPLRRLQLGFVNILAAEQRLGDTSWYQGTADAVRQNIDRLVETDPTEVVILSGDQLYLMDLKRFVESHRASGADLTIAVSPVNREEAASLGIMRLDRAGPIGGVRREAGGGLDARPAWRSTRPPSTASGIDAEPGSLLASMGIYVFRTQALVDLLSTEGDDFGKNLIPRAVDRIRRLRVRAPRLLAGHRDHRLLPRRQPGTDPPVAGAEPVRHRPAGVHPAPVPPAGQGERLPDLRVAAGRRVDPVRLGDPPLGRRHPVAGAVRFGDRAHHPDGQSVLSGRFGGHPARGSATTARSATPSSTATPASATAAASSTWKGSRRPTATGGTSGTASSWCPACR